MSYSLTVEDVWEDVSLFIQDKIIPNCQTDEILINKLEQLIIHVERDLLEKRSILSRIQVLTTVLNSHNYYLNSPLHRASEEEKMLVKELGQKFMLLSKVVRSQPRDMEIKDSNEQASFPKRGGDVTEMYQPVHN